MELGAAFIAIGLARVDVPRAVTELRSLLAAQWRTGMIPHIMFSAADGDYFPGPDRWDISRAPGRPTSGVREVIDFRVRDVFFSAILAAASEVLAGIGDELGRITEAAELRAIASRFRAGVTATVDPTTGLARDFDVRTGDWLGSLTVAGFAPLVAGAPPVLAARQLGLAARRGLMAHPALRFALPPSTSPDSPDFPRRTYLLAGPVWPFLNLLLGWAAARDHEWELHAALRDGSLRQLADLTFAEYYDPITGEPLGSVQQARTAAAALEWLG